MARLRSPEGCPWDREQDWRSLRRYLIEETYEVADAIDRGDPAALCEELGDLLLQIVFLSRIAEEQGQFDAEAVAHAISDKLVRRHPHVFGTATANTSAEVARSWEEIKRREKGDSPERPASRLDGIPQGLPSLAKAALIGERAAQSGFDWPSIEGVLVKIEEELGELRVASCAGDARGVTEEVGDLLFSVVNLARKTGVDPDAALEATNRKFRQRFAAIEAALAREGSKVEQVPLDELERLWQQAKAGG